MANVVVFDPDKHGDIWEEFIIASYGDPHYVALSPEFLRWQFLDNPANKTGAYTLWLVLHKKAVVAQLGFVPFIGRAPNGDAFDGAYPINLMVRPEFRAAGLGVMLLRKLLDTIPVVVNPGANPAGAAIALGVGLQDLGCLKRYINVINPESARAITLDARLPKVVGGCVQQTDSGDDTVVVTRSLPVGATGTFQTPVSAYAAERSSAFLRWRYYTHPAFTYEFVLSPDLQSVLVFHEEREPTTGLLVIRIVDFLAKAEHQDRLLGTVLKLARSRDAALVDFFCSLDCYRTALARAGFFDEDEHGDIRIAALFQPLDFCDASIRVMASPPVSADCTEVSWYITKADSDQDRPNDRRLIGGKCE